jgi:hypothetical protein
MRRAMNIRNEWTVGTNDVEELVRFGAGRLDSATLRTHLLEEGWPEADATELIAIVEEVLLGLRRAWRKIGAHALDKYVR